jgi:hypothetical protein
MLHHARSVLRAGHRTCHPVKTRVDVSFLGRKDDYLHPNPTSIIRRTSLVPFLHASMVVEVTEAVKYVFNYFVISQDESSILVL